MKVIDDKKSHPFDELSFSKKACLVVAVLTAFAGVFVWFVVVLFGI